MLVFTYAYENNPAMAAKSTKRGGGRRAGGAARGRPRRSAEQSDAVRVRVAEVARRLFAEEGFAAVSIRRIAEASGCGAMTLYGYFRSKNDILRHVWEDFFAELFRRIARVTARGTPGQKLQRACAAFVDYWCEHPQHYRIVFLNQDVVGAGERTYVEASTVVDRFEAFREWIAAMQADGSGRAGDPQRLSEALICALIGLCHAWVTIPEYRWQPRAALLDAALAIVRRDAPVSRPAP